MSLPFKRSRSPPESPGYFSGASTPRGSSPAWRSSKRRPVSGPGFDFKKLVQALVLAAVIVLFYFIVSAIFADSVPKAEITSHGNIAKNHFVDFEGGLDCRLSSTEIYQPPDHRTAAGRKAFPYCQSRSSLLTALSGGGRHGFDAPYLPEACHYKWYTPSEICMILDRFDGVVFIGDSLVQHIYAAFNVLLRRDLALGSLQQWKMTDKERDSCRCSKQFSNPDCHQYFVQSSEEVGANDPQSSYRAPYACNRIPHFYLPIVGSPAPEDLKDKFAALLDADPHSWKPIGIIHSLGIDTGFQWPQATESMDEWLTIADNSGRNSPFVWLGPNAAGHLKPPAKIMQEGNNALWHYTLEMGKEAQRRGVDSLGLYNATLQSNSWDGSHYGERVNVGHAMMIINWLAKLETT